MNLHLLPPDELTEILLTLDMTNLNYVCRSHSNIAAICSDPVFKRAYEIRHRHQEKREYAENPEMGAFIAGELGDQNLFEYFYDRAADDNVIYHAIEGAAKVKPSGNLFLDYLLEKYGSILTVEKINKNLLLGATQGEHWDYVQKLLNEGVDSRYYIAGLIRGGHLDKLVLFLNKLKKDGIIFPPNESLPLMNLFARQKDPRFAYALLDYNPELAPRLSRFLLLYGKYELAEDVRRQYEITLIPINYLVAVDSNDPHLLARLVEERSPDIRTINLLIESSAKPKRLAVLDELLDRWPEQAYDALARSIYGRNMELFLHIINYPGVRANADLNRLIDNAIESGAYNFVSVLEEMRGRHIGNIMTDVLIPLIRHYQYYPEQFEPYLDYPFYDSPVDYQEILDYLGNYEINQGIRDIILRRMPQPTL